MNDISNNKYLEGRRCCLQDYTLHDFLDHEIAVERSADLNKIMLSVGNLLSAFGFDMRLLGYKYLSAAVARYIVKSNYSDDTVLSELSRAYGLPTSFIRDNISVCIAENGRFTSLAQSILQSNIDTELSLYDAIEIIGALYKVYYNYRTDTEEFETDTDPAINYDRIVLNHGK